MIGDYEYPDTKLNECLRIAKILVSDFQGKANDVNAFADAIGHKSANSGTFLVKIADVRRCGLMDKREYRATNQAEIIANPKNENERIEAISNLVLSLPLFEKLFRRLKTKNPTVEQFRTQLMDITGDRNKASKEAEKIRKVYIDYVSHIRDGAEISEKQNDGFGNMENDLTQQQATGGELILFRAGKYNLSLPKDDESIKVLITLLENMKEVKEKKKKD